MSRLILEEFLLQFARVIGIWKRPAGRPHTS